MEEGYSSDSSRVTKTKLAKDCREDDTPSNDCQTSIKLQKCNGSELGCGFLSRYSATEICDAYLMRDKTESLSE